jgi:hypothetical protein
MIKKVLVLLGLVVLVACNNDLSQKVTKCYFPDAPKEKAPLWVCGALIEGVPASGVGSTNPSKAGINFMIQQATANARVVLAQQIQTDINSLVENNTQVVSDGNVEKVNIVNGITNKAVTTQSLQGTKVFKQVTSPNGILYVLVGYDKELYANYVSKVLEDSYKAQSNDWNKIVPAQSFEAMKKEIVNNIEQRQ